MPVLLVVAGAGGVCEKAGFSEQLTTMVRDAELNTALVCNLDSSLRAPN